MFLRKIKYCLLAVASIGLMSCASHPVDTQANEMVGQQLVTLVNLHPDFGKGGVPRLTMVNWLIPGSLLPMCTEVTIIDVNRKAATIKDKNTGVVYSYQRHKNIPENFGEHLAKYFGKTCDSAKVAQLSAIDRKGIKQGRILKGMTKQGVVYAAGYPPSHVTPHLDVDVWKYWKTRYDTLLVYFEGGKVSHIQD